MATMNTAKNAVFIGLLLENCCLEEGGNKNVFLGGGGWGGGSLLWENFYRWEGIMK